MTLRGGFGKIKKTKREMLMTVVNDDFLKEVGLVVSKVNDLHQQIKNLNKVGKDVSSRIEGSITRTLATVGIIEEHRRVGLDTKEAEDILVEIHESNKKIHKTLIDMKRFFC